jgi:ATP-binding cassette subfamily B protein
MLRIDVGLTLLCLVTTPVLWTISVRFSRAVRPAYDHNRDLSDQMLLTLTENVRGVHVVKGFVRQPEEIEKFCRANRAVRDQQRWIFWRVSLFTPAAEFLLSLNLVALLGYGGYLVLENRLAMGSGLIVLAGLLQQFAGQVGKMTNIVNSIQQSLAGAGRVFEILDAPIEVHSPPAARRLARSRGAVAFQGVSFHYLPGQAVLKDVDFRVAPGQRVAILAATGEGKTTLLNLIPRFYDPSGGRVLIDGLDLRRLDLDDLRRNIGIVFQENFLFSDSVAANIAFGRPGASMEQIQRAATIAAAHPFIMALPQGYHTVLREGGKDLSGGQRQRLAIARALLLEPPILLLDDPTAAIDPHTEEEILTAMEQAMTGRTTFFVAHRISTLRRADVVLVLRGGRILEMGTHEQLTARRGAYWQAARFQLHGAAPAAC